MAGGPVDHFTDGRWNWWLPCWAAHPPRPPVARADGDDPAPKPASGFTSDQLRGGRHSPSQLERPVAQVVPREGRGRSASPRRNVYKVANKRIPRISRRRSSEAPADPRRSPQITATEALLTAVLPAYPRPARNYQDRPVTPGVVRRGTTGAGPKGSLGRTLRYALSASGLHS
jgi:hypothetical protein